ncbi:hypothetical protein J3R83DRAFT_10365 [Lanmaoa asiatica]|nr:hypothetical protein J3R83DRAFT_10365 [Lanmaoa asiatica]
MPTIPLGAPAGIISVTQPPEQSTSYYKISPDEPITFAWNFSYIIVTPTRLTVSAVCENGNTYPVGPTDGIIAGTATGVVWDTYAYQTSHPHLHRISKADNSSCPHCPDRDETTSHPQLPLAQAKYTLKIWGDQGPDAHTRAWFPYSQRRREVRALYTTGIHAYCQWVVLHGVFRCDLTIRFPSRVCRVDGYTACHVPLGLVCPATSIRRGSEDIYDALSHLLSSMLLVLGILHTYTHIIWSY